MKVNISRFWVIYVLILFSFFDLILRLESDSAASLFRIASVIPFFILLLKCKKHFTKEIIIFLVFCVYNLAVSFVFYKSILKTVNWLVLLVYVFVLYVFVKYLSIKQINFNERLYSFINGFTIFTIILSYLQIVLRFQIMDVPVIESNLGTNAFYWTENELGAALAIMLPFYYTSLFFKGNLKELIKIVCIYVLLFLNDSKLSLIGAMVSLVVCLLLKNIKWLKQKMAGIIFAFIILGMIVCILYFWNPTLKFRDYSIDMNDLIFESLRRIATLTPYRSAGSIDDRTDAIIFGIQELLRSYGFGIGFGNTQLMLEKPQYMLVSAASMHNFVFQMLIECGYLALLGMIWIIKKLFADLKKGSISYIATLRIVYVSAFLFISAQSSGIVASYFVWVTAIYLTQYKINFIPT